jgi:hypothetical protein
MFNVRIPPTGAGHGISWGHLLRGIVAAAALILLADTLRWTVASHTFGYVHGNLKHYAGHPKERLVPYYALVANLRAYRTHSWDYAFRMQLLLTLGKVLEATQDTKIKVVLDRKNIDAAWRISASATPYHPALRRVRRMILRWRANSVPKTGDRLGGPMSN